VIYSPVITEESMKTLAVAVGEFLKKECFEWGINWIRIAWSWRDLYNI